MKVCYCHSCDCLFPETDMTIPGYCPICGAHNMMEVIHNKERAMRAIIYGSDYGDMHLGIETLILDWIEKGNGNHDEG